MPPPVRPFGSLACQSDVWASAGVQLPEDQACPLTGTRLTVIHSKRALPPLPRSLRAARPPIISHAHSKRRSVRHCAGLGALIKYNSQVIRQLLLNAVRGKLATGADLGPVITFVCTERCFSKDVRVEVLGKRAAIRTGNLSPQTCIFKPVTFQGE